jgi:alanine dehydrogenase
LINPATGRPDCVIDGNAVTTMRTGAAGGLGLMLLARSESTRVCLFGTGVQARIQLTYALRLIPGISCVRYLTAEEKRVRSFEALFLGQCDIEHVVDQNAAVAQSDIVITATPSTRALFDLEAVKPGTHLNCVGADTKGKRELPAGLLERARLFVDDRNQARLIGETQWAPDTPCTELGDLIAGRSQPRRQPTDITILDLTGIALQDLTVARLLRDRATAAGRGCSVPWPW